MNYRRAAIAVSAGVLALLIISTTMAVVLAISYGLTAKHLLGGDPQYDEILALTALPAAIGASGAFLTLALTGGWSRALMSAVTGLTLSFIVILRELAVDTYSPGSEERSIALAFVLVASLSVLIAIVRRSDVSLLRTIIIITFLIAFVVVLGTVSIIVPERSVYASVVMAFAAWIAPPVFAGLFVDSRE